jgi:hypothetical protein
MSLGVGHQFTSEFGVNVDYVRQHMDNLYVQRNVNYTDASVTPTRRKLTASYGDIILWDDIGTSDFSAFLTQATWQRNKTRLNLAYTLGWYQGDFDLAALPNFTYNFLFNRQRTTGDERHRIVLSELSNLPFGFTFSSITTLASPRPFLSIDGRDVNKNVATGDDYIGGTTTSSGNRTTMPASSFANWYRMVDVRLARPLYTRGGKKVSVSGEVFNLFNWRNNLSYNGTFWNTTTNQESTTFGKMTGVYAARQGQVGMKVEW